jgi:phage shock protein A
MGIFTRVQELLKANLNTLVNDGGPVHEVDRIARELDAALSASRREELALRTQAKQAQNDAERARAEAATWENRAVVAVKAGEDDLARQALSHKRRHLREATRCDQRASEQLALAERSERLAEELGQRVAEAKKRAQLRAAHAATTLSAGGGLEHIAKRIDAVEAELEASDVLGEHREQELIAKLDALAEKEELREADDELSALKRQLDG